SLNGAAPGPSHDRASVPHQRGCRGGRSQTSAAVGVRGESFVVEESWSAGGADGGGRGPAGLHQGDSGEIPGDREISGEVSALPGSVHVCADWSAQSHSYQALSRSAGRGGGGSGTHQLAIPFRSVEADCAAGTATQPSGDRAVLPGGRPLPGDLAARRDESCSKGIRRDAAGRARGIGSQLLYGRSAGI